MRSSLTKSFNCEKNGGNEHLNSTLNATIIGIGTATPPDAYTQQELLELFEIEDPRIRSLFLNSAISRRHLILPPLLNRESRKNETQADLLRKHRVNAIDLGDRAIRACAEVAGISLDEIEYLCCTTTTGFMSPGISALLSQKLKLSPTCGRLDIVGMGCHAGLNALNATASWALAHPGKLAIMLCVEVCSACYVFDNTMQTSVVNSLFGDGAAAIALMATNTETGKSSGPSVLNFQSRLISEEIDGMRFDWDESQGKFNFYLAPEIPYVIGANVENVVNGLLANAGLRRSDITHWLVHSGGKKVIDAVKVNLGLSSHDLRHTTAVLREYGNLSSGSFLFSYQKLLNEGITSPGDFGVMITMGPGATIESAILRWS